jgi:hypothetical protein
MYCTHVKGPTSKALLITLSDPSLNTAKTRPAQLDLHQAITISRTSAVYNEIFNNYIEWQKDYINPYRTGDYATDCGAFEPNKATFKDGQDIKGWVNTVCTRVENIMRRHDTSGKHKSGPEKMLEIRNEYIQPKGKTLDVAYYYAYLQLHEEDLNYMSWRLDENVGVEAGVSTEGGGALAVKHKKQRRETAHDNILSGARQLTDTLTETALLIRNDNRKMIQQLVSTPRYHSPNSGSPIDNVGSPIANSYHAIAGGYSISRNSIQNSTTKSVAKPEVDKTKSIRDTKEKMICYNRQIDYYLNVVSNQAFTAEEQQHAKIELQRIMGCITSLSEKMITKIVNRNFNKNDKKDS